MKRALLLAVLMLSASVNAADLLAGTWTLNVSKSTFATGTPPKTQTTLLESVDGGLREVVDRVNADGTTTHWELIAKYDGRDYPVKGDPARDTAALTRVDDYTLDLVNKKGGTVVNTMRISVAKDGKTRTNTVMIPGMTSKNVLLFERK